MAEIYVMLVIIILSILLLILQIFLSFRKNKWLGLIPSLLCVVLAFSFYFYSNHEINSYNVQTIKSFTENGYEMTIDVRYDGKGKMIDYSDVSIYDNAGNLLDKVSIDVDSQGKLVENDYSRGYIKEVDKLLGDTVLSGSPTLDSETEKMIKMIGGGYYNPPAFFYIALWPCIILLLIHIIIRIAIKKKRQKKELEKLKIENL